MGNRRTTVVENVTILDIADKGQAIARINDVVTSPIARVCNACRNLQLRQNQHAIQLSEAISPKVNVR